MRPWDAASSSRDVSNDSFMVLLISAWHRKRLENQKSQKKFVNIVFVFMFVLGCQEYGYQQRMSPAANHNPGSNL